MHTTRAFSVLFVLLALFAPAAAAAGSTYQVDPAHTAVTFSIRHFLTQVEGRFTTFDGTIVYDAAQPENSSVEFTVRADSINTNVQQRDNHLKSPDFFDVAKFPTLSFKSVKVAPTGKDSADVTGELTIHGVTKTITAPVKLTGVMSSKQFGDMAGFRTSFTIDRKDYGIVWNKAVDVGGMMLGDDVAITLDVAAITKPAAKPAPAEATKTPAPR